MPRFIVETFPVDATDRDRVVRLAAWRFPEIAIERRYTAHDEEPARAFWVCRAPSRSHLYRWTEAAGLAVGPVHPVDDETDPHAVGP